MSSSETLRNRIADRRLDTLAAVAGLAVAVVLFPLRFLASQVYVETIPIVVGVACLLYLFTTRKRTGTVGLPELSGEFARAAAGLVMVGVGALAFLGVRLGGRTPLFLAVAGLVGTLLLLQVAFVRESDLDSRLVLAQILALAFVVRFVALYTTPGLVGVDSWSHIYHYSDMILANHSLEAIAEFKYYAAPLYHLLIVATAEVLGVTLRQGLFLSVGTLMALLVLFVYSTARFFVPVRWALFAAAAVAIADEVLLWSIHLIPTSLGLFLFGAIVYVMARLFYTDSPRRNLSMLVVFSIAVILTHQVSSFIMLVLIGSGVLAQLLVRVSATQGWIPGGTDDPSGAAAESGASVNLLGVLAFDLGFLVFMWSITPYGNSSFLETTIAWLLITLESSAAFLNLAGGGGGGAAASAGSTLLEDVATYMDAGGKLLLLFVTVVGSLVALRRSDTRQRAYTFVGAIGFMLFFSFGFPLFGIRTFLPGRWFAFVYVLMAIVGVMGLGYLARTLPREAAVALLIVFAAVFPTVMLMSSRGTPDNPVMTGQRASPAFSEAEVAAVWTVADVRPHPDEYLYTDHPYKAVFQRTNAHPTEQLRLNENGRPPDDPGLVVYRRYQSYGATYFDGPNGASIRDVSPRQLCGPDTSRIYSNGDVRMCLTEDV